MKKLIVLLMLVFSLGFAQIYLEDFSAVGGFPQDADDRGMFMYGIDGDYSISVIQRNLAAIAINRNVPILSDVSLSVEATQSTQEFDALYGLSCRIQDNSERYVFLVSNIGLSYVIARTAMQPSGLEKMFVLKQGALAEDGPAGNKNLRADCIGNKLSLYINNRLIAEAIDNNLSQGYSGLTVSSAQAFTGIAMAFFDNFRAEEVTGAAPQSSTAQTTSISTNPSNIEPPYITANKDDATGTWVGRVRNDGLDGDYFWLNLTQIGNRVSGDAYLRPLDTSSYFLLGSFTGGFNAMKELDISFNPSSSAKSYGYGYEARFKLNFYSRSDGVKGIGNLWMNTRNTSDTSLVRSLDLIRK